ncbi:hypothetical protein RV14_GL001106 [Enterococcus ratti]|uniref:Uncharacterized protein n=1 Tax=Enterococcus ratti TaxID=150033 RepID=A0A1L8WCU9_9ENTE|nr:hypothetical protein RV14_GL001106 [Enterococcus ratti]
MVSSNLFYSFSKIAHLILYCQRFLDKKLSKKNKFYFQGFFMVKK